MQRGGGGSKLTKANNKIDQLTAEAAVAQKTIDRLKNDVQEAEKKLADKTAELDGANFNAKEAIDQLNFDINELEGEKAAIEKELADKTAELDGANFNAKEAIDQLNFDINELEGEKAAIEKELADKTVELDGAIFNAKEAIDQLNFDIEELEDELDKKTAVLESYNIRIVPDGTPLDLGGIVAPQIDPVYANDSEDTLKGVLSVTKNKFAPLTAALKRTSTNAMNADGKAYIESITSDGEGEGDIFVTFVIDGMPTEVQFVAGDYDNDEEYFSKETDGRRWEFWSYTDYFTEATSERAYLDTIGWITWPLYGNDGYGYRGFSTYGVETEPDNLPKGVAAYSGRINADTYDGDDPSSSTSRVRISAGLRLVVDFDKSRITGTTESIWERPHVATEWEQLEGIWFDILNGRIKDSRFTADWIGKFTDGYKGKMVGKFYGPAAEELGGVMEGHRDAISTGPDSRPESFLYGGFGASKLE